MNNSNSKYIGPYVLDWTKLQPCDIILSRWRKCEGNASNPSLKDRIVSGAIRPFSKGYSHAMLYFDGSIIHAHDPFVFSDNPQRISVANSDDLLFLRCRNLTDGQKVQIEKFVRGVIGSLYSIPQAVRTLVKRSGDEIDLSGVEFCSRLVAEAYQCAGIQLVKNFSYCTPGQFLDSPLLENMGSCTRLTTDEDRARLSTKDMVHESMCRVKMLLEGVRELAKQDEFEIETINSIFEYVLKFPNRDNDVLNCLKESQYLETWKEDAAAHGYRYNPLNMLFIREHQPGDFCNEVRCLFDCAGRYGDELMMLNKIKGRLNTLDAVVELYLNMLKDIQNRATCLVAIYLSQPGVGPLAKLSAICEHLVKGSYSQYYALPVCNEAAKLRNEWERQIGMSV